MGNKSTKGFNGTVKARERRKNALERLVAKREFIIKKLQQAATEADPDVVPKKSKKKKKVAENKNVPIPQDLGRIDQEIATLKNRI